MSVFIAALLALSIQFESGAPDMPDTGACEVFLGATFIVTSLQEAK